MKAVILAGGRGSRMGRETTLRPKPMVEIGGKPIIWHIMKTYSAHGVNDFVVCLGYLGYVLKEYFTNYFLHNSDITVDMAANSYEVHTSSAEPWRVTLVDTGEDAQTGGRLKAVSRYLDGDEDFCFTYGDGVADVDIRKLIAFHKEQGRLATLTAAHMPGRFGMLSLDGARVTSFVEKPKNAGFVNGGYFVLSPRVIDLIAGPDTVWEAGPLEELSRTGQLSAYLHEGFWCPMDTARDRDYLEDLWAGGRAPWRVW